MSKTVLITGCRSGFGLLAAKEAAEAGWTVYAGLRDLETRGQLEEETRGFSVIPIQLDVTRPAEREKAVAQILAEQCRIDALVNNAGLGFGGFMETVAEGELRRVLEVNFFSAWALTKACLPPMREAGSGKIIMVSSQ
ncbi:SDR family NAD(P)-dependent oxidoreductase, partial [Gemmatimonadota bacterium]